MRTDTLNRNNISVFVRIIEFVTDEYYFIESRYLLVIWVANQHVQNIQPRSVDVLKIRHNSLQLII